MDATEWDDRYAAVDRMWSAEPNGWLVDAVAELRPGRALDLACGEGRNAAWLHRVGWSVTAVDFSEVGIARGRAEEPGVDWVVADARTWRAPVAAFDLVAIVYLHLAPDERPSVLAGAAAALAPGGTLVVVGHDTRNLTEGVGGPQDVAILLDPVQVASELPLRVLRADTVERPVGDGIALDCIVVASASEHD